jgi:transposase
LPELGQRADHPTGQFLAFFLAPRVGAQCCLAYEFTLCGVDAFVSRRSRVGEPKMDAMLHGLAALDVASGEVRAKHYSRHRRIEFRDFMSRIVAEHPTQQIHVILDNFNTHKPKTDRWLARHPNVHFHFTPTRASWLNQIEIWFSILADQSLAGASFTSVAQLRSHIDSFIEAYNERAKPFAWTKSKGHQKRLKPRFADQ